MLRDLIAESLNADSRTEVLLPGCSPTTGGRLLDITELGRYPSRRLAEAIKIPRRHLPLPTCAVPLTAAI